MKIRIATGRALSGLLALLFSQASFAKPPAAPVVTVGAGLKQLQFDWNYVPRAGHYEVWFRSNPGAAWAKFADTPTWRPRANVNISGHLLHWIEARYVIKACNPSGCTSSPEIGVSQLMRDSVGYFKASTPLSAGPVGLGGEIAMSEDGSTIAAGSSRSIDGNVVVFRKGSAGWAEEAQLSPSLANQDRGGSVEYDVAINGNGTVIALSAPAEVRPGTDAGEFPSIGAVYVFRRTSSGWAQEQRIIADSQADDAFGTHVDFDESGTVLAVWRRWGEGKGPSEAGQSLGPVELYRHTSGGWVPLATIPVANDRCFVMDLSGDGRSLVRGCDDHVEVLAAPGWQRVARFPNAFAGIGPRPYERSVAISHDGRIVAARTRTVDYSDGEEFRTSVTIYRQGTAGWMRETAVTPGDWILPDGADYSPSNYGARLSMSRDGRFLAVSSHGDNAAGNGVQYPPFVAGGTGRGAVYVYERRPSGWRLRQFIKPNSAALDQYGFGPAFGAAVSLARNGKDLAVGAPAETSSALGIDGDQDDTSAPYRGAVWLY